MDFSATACLNAEKIAERVTLAASIRGISINKLLLNAGLSKSVVDRMKKGTMPGADKLAAVAAELDVPTDYLLGSGVFSKWDLILAHRTAVLSSIAGLMKDIASNLSADVDDLTLAHLVSSFSVDIDMGSDPAGVEILVISPFATHGAVSQSQADRPDIQEIEKAPIPGKISENGRRMLELFENLPAEKQTLLIGYIMGMSSIPPVDEPEPPASASSGERAV